MSGIKTRFCLAALAGFFLAGCSAMPNPLTSSAPAPVDGAVSEQADTGAAAPVAETAVEAPTLTYQWDTEFSAFLTPPIEVRRLAKSDCKADGYEVAVVETMKLDGNMATAVFICRGDFE